MSVTSASSISRFDQPHRKYGYTDAQHDRLVNFDAKFALYSSAFNVSAMTQHLRFYQALHSLATRAPNNERKEGDSPALSPALRAILTKALIRFDVWVRQVLAIRTSRGALSLFEVPPLDVLAVLHAYLLSPKIFDEDSAILFPQLRSITFPLEHMEALVHAESGEYCPIAEQIHLWESTTKLPFNVEFMESSFEVVCPSCNQASTIPLVGTDTPQVGARGFAETEFCHLCRCGFEITHVALAAKKLIDSLISVKEIQTGPHCVTEDTRETCFRRITISKQVIEVLGDPNDNLGESLGWSVDEARRRLEGPPPKLSKERVDDFLQPYAQSSPFSVDLVYKVYRQLLFASVLQKRGLLEGPVIKGAQQDVLAQHLQSYRLFLGLGLLRNVPKVCPTFGADLVWHTHQLSGFQYKKQTEDMLGRFMDHCTYESETFAAAPELYNKELDVSLAWRTALVSAGIRINDAVVFPSIAERPLTVSTPDETQSEVGVQGHPCHPPPLCGQGIASAEGASGEGKIKGGGGGPEAPDCEPKPLCGEGIADSGRDCDKRKIQGAGGGSAALVCEPNMCGEDDYAKKDGGGTSGGESIGITHETLDSDLGGYRAPPPIELLKTLFPALPTGSD